MECTKEQFNDIKSSPITQLLSIVIGKPIDDIMHDLDITTNNSAVEYSDDSSTNEYTLTIVKDDIKLIVTVIKNFYKEEAKLYDLGIDLSASGISDAIQTLIETLLSYLNDDFVEAYRSVDWITDDVDTITAIFLNLFIND